MRRITMISFGILATLALAVPLAVAQDLTIGKKGEVEFTAETHVGLTTLKPGHYLFQHQVVDGQHYLVVRAQTTVHGIAGTTSHWAGATQGEVVRVACRVVSTDKTQRATALHTRKDADGTARVTQIDIEGEKGGHVILEPQA